VVTLPAILVAACLHGLAAAPENPSADQSCTGAAALTSMTAAERDALVHTCNSNKADPEILRAAIFRLVSLAGARSAALARLVAPTRVGGARVLHED